METTDSQAAVETPNEFDSKIVELLEWFKNNPNLPEEVEVILLKRFLKCMNGNMEETKKVIELNYSMRNQHGFLFLDRDPLDESFRISRAVNTIAPLPGLTPERYKVFCYRLENVDSSVINNTEEVKIYYMLGDCRFAVPDDDKHADELDNLADGDVQIVDMNNYTMRHMARTSFSVLRIHMKFLQEALPVRLKAMHLINCPSYLDKMISIMRPFIHDDVYKMVHFHTQGLDSLYEHIPRDMLPDDYGGKAGKFDDLKDAWTQTILDKRDYLMDPKHWRVDQAAKGRSRWWWWS